jgi:hypothetical protein
MALCTHHRVRECIARPLQRNVHDHTLHAFRSAQHLVQHLVERAGRGGAGHQDREACGSVRSVGTSLRFAPVATTARAPDRH